MSTDTEKPAVRDWVWLDKDSRVEGYEPARVQVLRRGDTPGFYVVRNVATGSVVSVAEQRLSLPVYESEVTHGRGARERHDWQAQVGVCQCDAGETSARWAAESTGLAGDSEAHGQGH